MWTSLVISIVTSNGAKVLVLALLDYLVAHKKDGVTKDFAVSILDRIGDSKANSLTDNAIENIKGML